jgi:hypothetical protein
MSNDPARRRGLKGAVAVAIGAFDPGARAWASGPDPNTIPIPSLDGQLFADAATLAAAAEHPGKASSETALRNRSRVGLGPRNPARTVPWLRPAICSAHA